MKHLLSIQKMILKNNPLTTLNQMEALQMKPHHRRHQEILPILTPQIINSQKAQKVRLKLNQLQMKINLLRKFNVQQCQVRHQVMRLVHLLNLTKVEKLKILH